MPLRLAVSAAVRRAMAASTPVVVLESTVVSHGGLPFPQNLDLALALEALVANEGCVPCTVAVMGGQAKIGLSREELELLAKSSAVEKLSKRDLGGALALNTLGSTTVASTCFLAHRALGPCVFATGGLGGVHRGAFGGQDPTLDFSADLAVIASTPVAVVCSGVKSILHVPHTLEALEAMSVPVLTLQSKTFPTFFSLGNQDVLSPLSVNTPQEAAEVFRANLELGTGSGMILAVPCPDPLPDADAIIAQACLELETMAPKSDVAGKKATPWLLRRVGELSQGRSLRSNVGLLENNTRVAARLSQAFSLGQQRRSMSSLVVVGGAALDVRARASGPLMQGASVPGHVRVAPGGVGHNVASVVGLCCRALGKAKPTFITALGDDDLLIRKSLNDCGVRLERCAREEPTPRVVEIQDDQGELQLAVADFRCQVEEEDVRSLPDGAVVVVDGNQRHLVGALRAVSSKLLFEPASAKKAFLEPLDLACLDGATPNERELAVMSGGLGGGVEAQARFVLDAMRRGGDRDQFLLVSRGPKGVLLFTGEGTVLEMPPAQVDERFEENAIVTGAGDAQMGVLAFAMAHLPGLGWRAKLALAMRAGARTVRSPHAVRPDLGELLQRDLEDLALDGGAGWH